LITYANTTSREVSKGEAFVRASKVRSINESGGNVQMECIDGTTPVIVRFWRISKELLGTACACAMTSQKLCEHKVASLLFLRKMKGEYAFEMMRDLTADKNALLAEYGYTLEDDISRKFHFHFKDGVLTMDILDARLRKLSKPEDWKGLANMLPDRKKVEERLSLQEEATIETDEYGVGYGFTFSNRGHIPDMNITTLIGKLNYQGDRFKSGLKELREEDADLLPPADQETIKVSSVIHRILPNGIQNFLKKNRKRESGYVADLNDEEFQRAQRYVRKHLKRLLPILEGKLIGELSKNHKIKVNNFIPFRFSKQTPELIFELREDGNFMKLNSFLSVGGYPQPLTDFVRKNYLLLQQHKVVYLLDSVETASLLNKFYKENELKIQRKNFLTFYKNFLQKLMRNYRVQLFMDSEIEDLKVKPGRLLYLIELGEHLVLNPCLKYGEEEVALFGSERLFGESKEGELFEYVRDLDLEEELREQFLDMHDEFEKQSENYYLFLDFKQMVKNDWFLYAFDRFQKMGFELVGYDDLVRFKYNPNRPEISITGSSGIDWFDLRIEVKFGDQILSIKEIRDAILNNQNYIRLNDGTIGLLPEEWVLKNTTLLKTGELKGEDLRVSKLHFSLVEALFEDIDQGEIVAELRRKKKALQNFSSIREIEPPTNLKIQLRDYQRSAFSWMNFLNEFGWGGCLADDMGLGKTVQVLTFLQHLANQDPTCTHLVVLPTTLIFNWQQEIEKFTPDLTYQIHRGPDRGKNSDNFHKTNLVICSYGILVRDIEFFSQFMFDYVILDESQAIKNPNSKRFKAARLLKAKNRLVMTGTPVENNTFDLYAQMNFLNPGLLGSMAFFKEEFAVPIDRDGDKVKVEQLKSLIFPFILRRTKEQVAKELPSKTENVLLCDMGKKQRKLYDKMKQKYREQIMTRLDQDGLGKSSFYVLEGLLKLRQICDSPMLIGAENVDGLEDSVKIDELMSHIMEKTSNHKILVFSQFVGMLTLIRKRLDQADVVYEYLDGATKDRREPVRRFQEDNTCRVFLISLRAGGVGINLTEADYVFLIDPWWNPAVEAQAIDRTHRIGQSKNVFSYKMICKNTIEEKVLKLQDKKRHLVSELISTEKSFFKQLKKDDIRELFD